MQRKPVVCMFFIEKTVEKLNEKKREQVSTSLNFLVVFLIGLVFDEKHVRVYAKKPAHAQNKV